MSAALYNPSDWPSNYRPHINKARKAVAKFVETGDAMHLTHARNHLAKTRVPEYGLVLDDLLAQRGTNWQQIETASARKERELLWQTSLPGIVENIKSALTGVGSLYPVKLAMENIGWTDKDALAQQCGQPDFEALEVACCDARLRRLLEEVNKADDDAAWEGLAREILRTEEFHSLGETMETFVAILGGTKEQAESLDRAWIRLLSRETSFFGR